MTPATGRSGGGSDIGAFVARCSLGDPAGPAVAVKDTIDIAGLPTRAGSRALADAPPAIRHAVVVQRLIDAGCHIVGKTTLHELAFGITGINDWAGTPVNPRYPDLIPGGSSSGSAAAVAAGEVAFAIGTDTGGSIRIPAACCGVWGLKPTFGRVSRVGAMPARSSLDCIGPFAVSAEQLQRAMAAIDPTFRRESVAAPRIGVVAVNAAAPVLAAVRAVLDRSGFALRDLCLDGLDDAFAAGLAVINAETWAACRDLVATGRLGEDVARRLVAASSTALEELEAAEAVRRRFATEIDHRLDGVDVLALPTLADRPPTLAEGRGNRSAVALSRFVRPFNLSGHPALTLPLTGDSGPVGLQLVGRRGEDAKVCTVAAALAASLH